MELAATDRSGLTLNGAAEARHAITTLTASTFEPQACGRLPEQGSDPQEVAAASSLS